MTLKRTIAPLIRPLAKALLAIFFDAEYLRGRHFDQGLGGFVWAARAAWSRNILRLGPTYPWPVSIHTHINKATNVSFHPDDLNNFQSPGVYFQNTRARIRIGKGTYIGPNVGLITSNHDPLDLDAHLPARDIELGEGCWIGMNAVVLPGVMLGPRTVVAAGAVVTRSFPEGHVTVGGVPAREIGSA